MRPTSINKVGEMLSQPNINQTCGRASINEVNVYHFVFFKHLSPNDTNLRDIISVK